MEIKEAFGSVQPFRAFQSLKWKQIFWNFALDAMYYVYIYILMFIEVVKENDLFDLFVLESIIILGNIL